MGKITKEVLALFETELPKKEQEPKEQGLTEREAAQRLKADGLNVLAGKKGSSALKIFLGQFKDTMVIILLAATALSWVMGETTEALAIVLIVALNALLGFVQEFRTEKTLEALKEMAAPRAHVIRGGKEQSVPAAEVVRGDLVLLHAGDRVPADGLIVSARGVSLDEALLTGESVPVDKGEQEQVFMGTVVTRGEAKAVVTGTGMQTEMGKIAGLLQNIDDEETPLQKRLGRLGKIIGIGCLGICAVVTLTGIIRGENILDMLITGISLAVAAVPEGLPAIVTISLALGVRRMLQKNALIRRLPAVETLGCATVICSDKTGTLTENKMTVLEAVTCDKSFQVTGSGTEPAGKFYHLGEEVSLNEVPELREALTAAAVCNHARVLPKGKDRKLFSFGKRTPGWKTEGEPTEAALALCAAKGGIGYGLSELWGEVIDEAPFDSERKRMSVLTLENGKYTLYIKGAPDVLLNRCTRVRTKGGAVALTPKIKRKILGENEKMAREALRVIAVAVREISERPKDLSEAEKELTFVGLFGMMDPPRKEAKGAVRKCLTAGIRPVMITGDHPLTAEAIAEKIGIPKGEVLTGADLDKMSDEALLERVTEVSVFARVTPLHKLRVVRAFKARGHVVAMTGDGVNDAPAVKEADIGVAMGKSGTDVTKEAAAMVLLDDNFSTLVTAVEEGRVIYRNIRKFIRYLLSCNIGEVLTMFLGMLLGFPMVLLPIQILWVNFVTDGLPAIALGLEPADKDVMRERPRAKNGIFSDGLGGLIVFRGILIGLCTLAAFQWILTRTGDLSRGRTAAFLTLVLTQLIHVFECKSEKKSILHMNLGNNKALIGAVCFSFLMIMAAIYFPPLQPVFGTVSLTLHDLLLVGGLTLFGPVLSAWVMGTKRKTKLTKIE